MSELELKELIETMQTERYHHASTPEQAEQFLKELGFLDDNGDLAKPYAKQAA